HRLAKQTLVGSEVKQKKKPARKKITPSEPKNTRKNNLKNAPQKGNGISCTKTELSSTAPLLIDNPLSGLNPDQRRAAESKTGPLLVVAGPGTGKTRTLVARIAHQVQNGTVRPKQVLAIAFTNQAAEELRERISHAVPGATDRAPLVTTFHGLGLSLLKEFGNIDNFSVLGNDERLDIGKAVAGPDVKKREVETMVSQISLAKQSTDPIAAMNDDPELIASFKRYETILRERNALDVDDLVLRAYQMLANDDQVASTIAKQYLSISVDEYQDVNDVQAALIKLLAPGGHSLLAIGDPEQAIYGFRGARPDHFARFDEAFPGALVISLNTTYRLTDKVLAAARSVVGSTTGSTTDNLVSQKNGPPVEIAACPTPESEAEQIVVRLEQIIGGTSYFAIDSGRGGNDEELNVGFGDIAILCRTKAQRKEILAALGQSGIPCRTVGEDEPHDPRSEKVAVMTMHASKGREFDTIFISGVEPCLVPLEIEGITSDHEEERRLLYVAMTRAKRLAVLSHASKRMMFGKVLPGGSSRFLANLPKSAVEYKSPSLPARKPASKQLSLF
ncbi:MAG: ATP-dependent helicase, partial [Proteobacteria bacterium]|nr:ATP-dependent helicase [Pseudomonadota bacterium]